MSARNDLPEQLKDKVLFRDFSAEELEQFLELLDTVRVQAGEIVVRQDDSGDCMYILVQGSARVVHRKGDRDIELAVLRPGDFFGEIALVDHGPRSADVEALEDSVLLRISQAVISAVAGVYPTAAFKFLVALGRIIVQRLRKSNQRYVDSLMFPGAGKD